MQIIELTAEPDQKFSVFFNNTRITMRFRYNTVNERWAYDLSMDDKPIMHGRRAVLGANILPDYLGLGKMILVANQKNAEPDFDNLTNGTVEIYQADDKDLVDETVST